MSEVLKYLNGIYHLFSTGSQQGSRARAYYKWILKTGQLFTEKGEVKKFHPTFKKMFKGCYYNAQFMSMEYKKLKYYEGWGVTKAVGIPLEHAFNVINGKVVDISWLDGVEYFGVEIPVEFAMTEMLKESTAHTLLFRWWERINIKEVET